MTFTPSQLKAPLFLLTYCFSSLTCFVPPGETSKGFFFHWSEPVNQCPGTLMEITHLKSRDVSEAVLDEPAASAVWWQCSLVRIINFNDHCDNHHRFRIPWSSRRVDVIERDGINSCPQPTPAYKQTRLLRQFSLWSALKHSFRSVKMELWKRSRVKILRNTVHSADLEAGKTEALAWDETLWCNFLSVYMRISSGVLALLSLSVIYSQ